MVTDVQTCKDGHVISEPSAAPRPPALPLALFALALSMACAHARPPGEPVAGEPADPVARAEVVRRCVQRAYSDRQAPYTGTAESFVFEIIAREHDAFMALPPERFCNEVVLGRLPEGRAPAGTDDVESDREIIAFVQNHTWGHVLGHSDITRLACLDPAVGWDADGDACRLLRSASQSPDFFHWYEDVFHAQTREDLPGNQAEREVASTAHFLEHMARHLDAARDRQAEAQLGWALFELGVALHGVQDLVFHQGMTLRQHAGLSYYLHRNPDTLPGTAGEARIAEATRASVRLLAHFQKTRGVPLAALSSWRKPAGYTYLTSARRWTGREEDISVVGLARYWALSLPYRFGRSAEELKEGKLARWDVGRVLDELLAPRAVASATAQPLLE